jgi:hypothetical protein
MRLFYYRNIWRLTRAGDQIITTADRNFIRCVDLKIEIIGLGWPLRAAEANLRNVALCAKKNDSHQPDGRPSRHLSVAFYFEATYAAVIGLIQGSKTPA